jgi:hypothetical protein
MANYHQMNKAEMREYAAESFGLAFDEDATRAAMIDKLREFDPPAEAAAPKQAAAVNGETRYRVTIHEQDGPGGGDDVYVAVNSRGNQYKRGVEVEMPRPYLEALKAARIDRVMPDESHREVPRYAFTVHGEAA